MQPLILDRFETVRHEYEKFITLHKKGLYEDIFQWLFQCIGDIDNSFSEHHINIVLSLQNQFNMKRLGYIFN